MFSPYTVMSASNPRKRPAPGTSPLPTTLPQMQQPFNGGQPDQVPRWTGSAGGRAGIDGTNFADATSRTVNQFGSVVSPTLPNAAGQFAQGVPAQSMALARRGLNQALVQANTRPSFDPNSDSWSNFGDDPAAFLQASTDQSGEHDSIEALEERAKRVMREAGASRKTIPPFVQKLASFLEEPQNAHLIRWNEAGDGFIVLDEDEFARTLIPELFKHSNYASFVRQLNMYGFHKRVGLSDNSMKASERKNKAPSEYYNAYFRRGHPNLLWLINKPKSGNKKKPNSKKDDGDAGSDDEGAEEIYSSLNNNAHLHNLNSASATGSGIPANHATAQQLASEVGPLQKKDIIQVRTQLEKLQQQQVAISALLGQMRKEHNQLFQQAVTFQDQHNRHENSINAILNFLANVFRKSLEEQGGVQSVQDLLASIIPTAQGHVQNQMAQGSVVDLGDFFNQHMAGPSVVAPPKRQQRLLPPPPMQSGTAATLSPSSTAPPTPHPAYLNAHQTGSVTELIDTSPSDTSSPAYIKNELQMNPRQGMMKIIQDTNAGSASPSINLANVAASTPSTITNDQRAKMLNIMAGQGSAAAPSSAPAAAAAAPSSAAPRLNPGVPGLNRTTSLSPTIPPSMPPPNIQELHERSNQFDALQRLTDGTAHGIAELTNLLGPLSPSGRVPGIDSDGNPTGYFDNVDYDQFLDNNAFSDLNYDPNFTATDGTDFNFDLDASHDFNGSTGLGLDVPTGAGGAGTGIFESGKVVDATDTPSPAGTEEITRTDLDSPERGVKRRRRD